MRESDQRDYSISDYILDIQCPLRDSLILVSELIPQTVPENSVCTFSILVMSNLANNSTNSMIFPKFNQGIIGNDDDHN